MSLAIGIVGLPNAGKSTLFQALTRKQVLIASYPFATIDPNKGIVPVPDERLNKLAEVSKSAKIVPATVEFVDIAGLVRGASQGEGLGNAFLGHIREVDAIAHVVRVFGDPNVTHVYGAVNPSDDTEIIEYELILADKATVEKRLEAVVPKVRAGQADAATKFYIALLERVGAAFNQGTAARALNLTEEEKLQLRDLNLLTIKPVMYVFNVDDAAADISQYIPPGATAIAINAKVEAELTELPEDEARQYMQEFGLEENGLDRLIRAGYSLLGLITFFTSGPTETRAWTIKQGTLAPQAAGVIHTDFERGFIRAEIGNWKDFIELGGEATLKAKGLWRIEGKEYIMQDGDVCFFRFSV